LDAKGRCVVPKVFRSQLGERVHLTRGAEGCIWLFAEDEWRKFAARIGRRSPLSADGLLLSRYFLGTCFEAAFDRMGRVPIPAALREWAGLKGEVVVAGVGSRIEIWPAQKWDAAMSEMTSDRLRALGLYP
jgi:MraZ protein